MFIALSRYYTSFIMQFYRVLQIVRSSFEVDEKILWLLKRNKNINLKIQTNWTSHNIAFNKIRGPVYL